MTIGNRIIFLYLTISYLIPMIGNYLFEKNIISVFKIYPLSLSAVINLIVVFLSYIIISKLGMPFINFSINTILVNRLKMIYKRFKNLIYFYLRSRKFLAVGFLIFSIVFFYFGYSIYRYKPINISDINSPILLIGMLIQHFIMVDLLFAIFFSLKTSHIKCSIANILMATSLIFFADGTGGAFLAFILCSYALFPNHFTRLISIQNNESFKVLALRIFLTSVFFIFIFLMAWVYGEAVKSASSGGAKEIIGSIVGLKKGRAFSEAFPVQNNILELKSEHAQAKEKMVAASGNWYGYNFTKKPKENEVKTPASEAGISKAGKISDERNFIFFIKQYVYYLIERSSVFYYSYLYTNENFVDLPSFPWIFPLQNFLFRMDYLFFGKDLGFEKPIIPSICRLNHLLVSDVEINSKTGSSPGLLASFNYMFQFPFNIILCVLYLCFLEYIFNNFIQSQSKSITTFGVLLLYFFFLPFFSSPFDYLIFFDVTVFYVLLIFLISIGVKKIKM